VKGKEEEAQGTRRGEEEKTCRGIQKEEGKARENSRRNCLKSRQKEKEEETKNRKFH